MHNPQRLLVRSLTMRTVSILCLSYILLLKVLPIAGIKSNDPPQYDMSKYYFNTSYHCFLFDVPRAKEGYIRRCHFVFNNIFDYSPVCIFCPQDCSFCASPVVRYSYGMTAEIYQGAADVKAECHLHSVHYIDQKKIRARKGVTVKDDLKCLPKNHCKSSPCKNQGTCVKLYFSYTCICTNDFYGKNCDKSAGKFAGKLTHGVQLWFPLEVIAGRVYPFMVTVAHEGEKQVIQISNNQNNHMLILTPTDKSQDFAAKCKNNKLCGCDEKACKAVYKGNMMSTQYYLKKNFLTLPQVFHIYNAYAFVSSVTIRVFNEDFSTKDPVFEDTIPSYTRLRIQRLYYLVVLPHSNCQLYSKSDAISSSPNLCTPYASKPKIRPDITTTFSFETLWVTYGWNMFKKKEDKFDEVGESFTKQPKICRQDYRTEVFWRVYKVQNMHKLTDKFDETKKLEEPMTCKEKSGNDITDVQTSCQADFRKIKPGDYTVRLTLKVYSQTVDKIRYIENWQNNYYCFFQMLAGKDRNLTIVGDAVINRCDVNIDLKGYVEGDGVLVWTCEPLDKSPKCPPEVVTNNKPYLPKTQFPAGEYKVCVTWQTDTPVPTVCVKVVCKKTPEPEPQKPDLIISCIENCGDFPDPNTPQKVGVIDRNTGEPPKSNITWEITTPDGKVIPVGDVSVTEGVRPNEIKINITKLDPNVPYTVVAKDKEGDKTPPYTVTYKPIEAPKDGNCTMTPKSGMKGFTLFDITCFGWQSEGPILYEFFDKGPEDIEHYQGRMTGYSYSGILSKFRLTRGKVVIYLLNEDGQGSAVNISVELTDFDRNMTHIEYLMDEISDYMAYGNFQPALDIMSTLAEILYSDMNNDYYIRRIISAMTKVELDSCESMKLELSTILSVLVNGTQKGTYKLDDVLEMYTGRILLHIAQVYLKYAIKPDHRPKLRTPYIHQLSRNIMDCVDMTMIAQDKNVTKLGPEEDIKYDVMDNLAFASSDISEALLIAMYLVGKVQSYGAAGMQIKSTEAVTDLWAYVNDADGLVNVAGANISSFVNMSQSLANTFNDNHDIMLQFAYMKDNLFWWAKDNVNTELIVVGLAEKLYRPGYYYVPRVETPIQIFLKVKKVDKTTIVGNVTQLDPTLDTDTLDRTVQVRRFNLPPLSKLFLTFKFDSNSSASSLRVLVSFNERPDWEAMTEAPLVSAENPQVVVPYDIIEREHFYYMGILPEKSVPVNDTVTYSFELHYVNCHIWENQWINHYCEVGPKTTEETVECLCTHLSIFSSSLFVPPNDINPILDAPLFLTVMDNPWVVIFVIIILLLFLLLLLWTFRKDRRDALCSDVIVLHDNFPGESYAYLIAVFTGSRITSGTSAVVGFRLYGDTYASRPTILKCETRKVLQRDHDDWFLMCYPVSLGVINAVQMWHDNAGCSPDWYCSKIIVYDIKQKIQYLFVVEQWLAMEVDEFPEAIVRPATSDEVLSIKRIFLDNSVLGFRENHLHLSVLTRHPRSPVTRKQRLVCLMVLVMSSMLASIMFFKVSDNFDPTVDDYCYNFGERELMISIESLIISGLFAFVAMFLFRKGYKQKAFQKHHSTLFMPRKRSSMTDTNWLSTKPDYVDLSTFIAYDEKPPKMRKDMSLFESFVVAIKNCQHQKALRPVHLATEGSEIKEKKGWLIAAWIFSALVIIISAYLVMLYSLKFGKVKSLKWLSSLVMTQAEEIFLFSPAKILIIALLLSAAFERTTDISSFKLDVNEAVKRDLIGDQDYLKSLMALREKSIYYPMTDAVKAKKRRKAMRKMKWRIIFDFLAVLVFILVLCYIMAILWSGAHYEPNSHASDIIMTKYHGRFVALKDIFNETQFFSYLENTFVRSLFVFRWFNDLRFAILSPPGTYERKDWTKDYVSKMVGAPRLRQLRVFPGHCIIPQMLMATVKECFRPWSERYMDTDMYGVKWQKADLDDEVAYAWGFHTYWMYEEPKNTSVFPVTGKSGIEYPTGGYILPLAVKRELSKSYAIHVEQEHWVDQRTRAVFLELTLYNVNNNLFSQVTAIIEHMTSGLYMAAINVDSVHTKEDFRVLNVIYIIFIFALVLRVIYKTNRNGVIHFFSHFLNLYEVIVIVFGVLSVICYLIHTKVSTIYVEEFQRAGLDLFFNFEDMIKYFRYTKALLWVLFCLLVLRLFVSWYFGKRYVYYYNTMVMSSGWIVIFAFFFLFYFYFIWRFIGYIIDAKIFYNNRVLILHNKMYSALFSTYSHTRTKLVAFALCFVVLIFKTIFLVMFTHYFEIGRRKKLQPMQYFNFFTFLLSEVKKCLGKKIENEFKSDRQIHRKRDVH